MALATLRGLSVACEARLPTAALFKQRPRRKKPKFVSHFSAPAKSSVKSNPTILLIYAPVHSQAGANILKIAYIVYDPDGSAVATSRVARNRTNCLQLVFRKL